MDKVLAFTKKMIYPPVCVRIWIMVIGFISLIPVLGLSISDVFLAYAAYLISAYALILLLAWICQKGKILAGRAKQNILQKHGIAARYVTDQYFRVSVSLACSLLINLGYAVLKAVSAILFSAEWTGFIAAYYIALCIVRVYLMTRFLSAKEHCWEQEVLYYRRTAVFLLLINVSLSALIYKIVQEGETYTYSGFIIFAYAGYTFYSFGSSIYHMVKYRRYHSPLLSAVKVVGFTSALVSVLSLQTAMLTQFGTDHDFSHKMANAITGTVVCTVIFLFALSMLNRSHRMEKKDSERQKNAVK